MSIPLPAVAGLPPFFKNAPLTGAFGGSKNPNFLSSASCYYFSVETMSKLIYISPLFLLEVLLK